MTASLTAPVPSQIRQAPCSAVQPFPSPSRLDSILLYATFSLLMFGPLAFGAVEWWSIFVMEAGAGLLFLLWAIRHYVSKELQVSGHPLFPAMVVFAVLFAVQIA